jgi:malonate-semialdehyde dehydrogenase (acetylating) / methylmalonate-semialdehyde dehydrogenase
MRSIGHWIDGQRVTTGSARTAPVFNPATGEVQAEVLLAGPEDVRAAVRCAAERFASWSQSSLSARTEILFAFRALVHSHKQQLAEVISDEHGKVLSDAAGEVQRGLEVVEFACGIPTLLKGSYSDQVSTGVDVYSFREPLGVVAGITPFNFPAMVPMWMYPVAIACGNTFVLKPSERDPGVSALIAELWQRAGLPDGVFNVVNGDKEAVDALLDAPEVAAVSFVGSTPIARYIHQRASENGKRVQALGGAKNHAVVLPDADLDFAADHLVASAFGSAGERCMAISAAVAVGRQADALLETVAAKARAVRVGPGRQPDSEMGPVITAAARERIVSLIGTGERQGAELLVDGRGLAVPGHEDGFFVGPTVIDRVRPEMDVYREEIFGPVLSVLTFRTPSEAVEKANNTPYGLSAGVWTDKGSRILKMANALRAGVVWANTFNKFDPTSPFGGYKESGYGREGGRHGLEGYLKGQGLR